jgi:hypothetical protein
MHRFTTEDIRQGLNDAGAASVWTEYHETTGADAWHAVTPCEVGGAVVRVLVERPTTGAGVTVHAFYDDAAPERFGAPVECSDLAAFRAAVRSIMRHEPGGVCSGSWGGHRCAACDAATMRWVEVLTAAGCVEVTEQHTGGGCWVLEGRTGNVWVVLTEPEDVRVPTGARADLGLYTADEWGGWGDAPDTFCTVTCDGLAATLADLDAAPVVLVGDVVCVNGWELAVVAVEGDTLTTRGGRRLAVREASYVRRGDRVVWSSYAAHGRR